MKRVSAFVALAVACFALLLNGVHARAVAGGGGVYLDGNVKGLSTTSGATTTFALVSTVTGSAIGGHVFYTVEASTSSNWDVTSGSFSFCAVNKSGTTSVNVSTVVGTSVIQNSGTLSLASAVTTSGTSLALQVTPTWTTIVPTKVQITYTIISQGPCQVVPQ